MKDVRFIQDELAYVYNAAQARMESHKELAAEYKKILDKHGYLTREEALGKAKSCKEPHKYQVWANIKKDEEFFYLADKWIVSDDYRILTAAEYIGFDPIPFYDFIGS